MNIKKSKEEWRSSFMKDLGKLSLNIVIAVVPVIIKHLIDSRKS